MEQLVSLETLEWVAGAALRAVLLSDLHWVLARHLKCCGSWKAYQDQTGSLVRSNCPAAVNWNQSLLSHPN
jgi:hypothetical protein